MYFLEKKSTENEIKFSKKEKKSTENEFPPER